MNERCDSFQQGPDAGQLREEAEVNEWYTPGGGTPLDDTGNLPAAHGLEVERDQGAAIDELSSALVRGEKVMAGLDAEEIWAPGADSGSLDEYPGIPGQGAGHAVEVIGIEQNNPNGPIAVLNDPEHLDGRGVIVPLGQFEAAGQDSGDFAVIAAAGNSSQSAAHSRCTTSFWSVPRGVSQSRASSLTSSPCCFASS